MRYRLLWGVAAVVFVLDQLTKWWAVAAIPEHRSITVIPGFFDLVIVRNRGAAFGFLNRPDMDWQFWLFLAATVVAVGAIIVLARGARGNVPFLVGLGLVLGGALGNLLDRLRYRAVVDFLDFYVGQWHWPAFNVADIGICLGALCTCVVMWRAEAQARGGKGGAS